MFCVSDRCCGEVVSPSCRAAVACGAASPWDAHGLLGWESSQWCGVAPPTEWQQRPWCCLLGHPAPPPPPRPATRGVPSGAGVCEPVCGPVFPQSLHMQKSDADQLRTKLRRLEEENARKDRQIEQLLGPSRVSPGPGVVPWTDSPGRRPHLATDGVGAEVNLNCEASHLHLLAQGPDFVCTLADKRLDTSWVSTARSRTGDLPAGFSLTTSCNARCTGRAQSSRNHPPWGPRDYQTLHRGCEGARVSRSPQARGSLPTTAEQTRHASPATLIENRSEAERAQTYRTCRRRPVLSHEAHQGEGHKTPGAGAIVGPVLWQQTHLRRKCPTADGL